jgi:hypothetical protein
MSIHGIVPVNATINFKKQSTRKIAERRKKEREEHLEHIKITCMKLQDKRSMMSLKAMLFLGF